MPNNLQKRIIEICKYDYAYFLCKLNVVGVACGFKRIKGIVTSQLCLQIFVEKKVPANCLDENNLIPKIYKNLPTDVIETGKFQATSLTGRVRPVTGGYSVGPINTRISGSYAGLVTDNNKLYMLSNNHVIANDNTLPLGTTILQPAPYDGGISPRDDVANLSKFIPIQFATPSSKPINYVDAAIAEVINPALFSRDTTYIGAPTGIIEPDLGLKVQLTGSTSEYLSGSIVCIEGIVTAEFTPQNRALFVEQIFIDKVCEKGDSGCFVFDFNRKVVGLLMAACSIFSVVNPITTVLNSLDVKLVTS